MERNQESPNPRTPKIVTAFQKHLAEKPESNFVKLSGEKQRALLNEANLQVRGYQLSETYGAWASDNKNARLLLTAFCEHYAADPVKIEQLVKHDSEHNYKRPMNQDKEAYYQNSARSIAKSIDAGYHEKDYKFTRPDAKWSHQAFVAKKVYDR